MPMYVFGQVNVSMCAFSLGLMSVTWVRSWDAAKLSRKTWVARGLKSFVGQVKELFANAKLGLRVNELKLKVI